MAYGRCVACGERPVRGLTPDEAATVEPEVRVAFVPIDGSGRCDRCVLDTVAPEMCTECGTAEAAYEGLCYRCQTRLHALGVYDMDGQGYAGPFGRRI